MDENSTMPKDIAEPEIMDSDEDIFDNPSIESPIVEQAISILRDQFPSIKGLFSLKGTCKKIFPAQHDSNYKTVQIHHKGRGEWVVSYCDVKADHIYLYDSNLKLKRSGKPIVWNGIKIQLAKLYGFEGKLIIKCPQLPAIPDLKNSILYAIAYAIEICLNKNAKMVKFRDSEMRNHYEKCIEQHSFIAFPQEKLNKALPILSITVPLICICRMPQCYKKYLMRCRNCQKRFHKKCFRRKIRWHSWYCPACQHVR